MGKKRPDPEPEGAPAYMAQFTALMTILLAFFITMLTMGQNRTSKYKAGTGYVRNAFGSKGGVGLMPFLKSMMKHHPDVKKEEDDIEGDFLGYKKGTFLAPRFDAKGIAGTESEKMGFSIKLASTIRFEDEKTALTAEAMQFLNRISTVFISLPQHTVTTCCYVSTGKAELDLILAAKRSSVINKYLSKACSIPRKQLRSVGYEFNRYIAPLKENENEQAVVFLVRKSSARKQL